MRPLDQVAKGDVLDEDQDPNVPQHLRFAVLWWKEFEDGPGSGLDAAFADRFDAEDWARGTAHSDMHTDMCKRVYLVVEAGSREVLAVEQCRGAYCRCTF